VKILLINTLYFPYIVGGAERSVQLLAESLVQNGHEVVVVSLNPSSKLIVDTVNGVKVYYLCLKNLYWPYHKEKKRSKPLKAIWHLMDSYNILAIQDIINILNLEKPDIVHTNNISGFSAAVWKTIKELDYPLVHTIRDYYLLCARSSMFKNNKNCITQCTSCKFYSLPRIKASNHVDAVIGISKFVIDQHLQNGFFSKVKHRKVIFNSCKTSSRLVQSNQLCQPTLNIGYLGILHPAKGINLLLDVLEKLPNKNWRIFIAGKGEPEFEARLRERYRSNDIHFLGFVKPEHLFSKIDVLIVPSIWHEPLGRVVLEAYSYGVPVATSNKGGMPEVVNEGVTGFIFDPDTSKSLYDIILSLTKDKQYLSGMRNNCLKESIRFATGKIYKQYIEIYAQFQKS